jgi:hypothetical protein
MGRGGQWTSLHSKHVAEAMLAATEDPIAGIDQKADAFKQKLWEEFVSKDPSPASAKKYRDRTLSAVFLQSKAISKDIMVFQKSVLFVKACKPTGNLTDEDLMSLAVARHTGIMQGAGLDYSFKDTPHSDWVLSDAFKVLKRAPKWQGNDGPVMDLAGGSSTTSTDSAVPSSAIDEASAVPMVRKKAKRVRAEDSSVSKAMLAMAKSMAASADSVKTNAAAQTERNGIMLFVGKIDDGDQAAKEYFALKRKIHLESARIEASSATRGQVLAPSTMPQSTSLYFEDNEFSNGEGNEE